MNRLEAMRTFTRVAELASFTRAAETLGLPKASASIAVQQLETLLGTRLLHRTTRRVELTHDGRAFYERCKDLLADVDELEAMFRDDADALGGRLRVDLPNHIACDLVIPALPGLLDAHPGLEVELSVTDRLVDVVREGFDCVLRVGTLADSSLIARPIGTLAMVNCASPHYLDRHGTPQSIEDLATHRLIHYATTLGSRPFGWEYPSEGGYRTLQMPGVITVNSSDAYQAACLAGLGLVQVPRLGVREHLQRGTLVEVLPAYPAEPMPVTLLYPHRRNLSRRVQLFMNWLASLLEPVLAED